jgi:hypothetical protein
MIAASVLTGIFALLSVGSGAALMVLVWLDHRSSRIDNSIARFQRHINALSSEARGETRIQAGSNPDEWYR